MAGKKKLEAHTPRELVDLSLAPDGAAKIRALREEAFPRLAAGMKPTPELKAWAAEMTARHGPKVRVHASELPWLAALAVVRYGEAPGFWKGKKFTAEDLERAKRWTKGDVPTGVTYILAEED